MCVNGNEEVLTHTTSQLTVNKPRKLTTSTKAEEGVEQLSFAKRGYVIQGMVLVVRKKYITLRERSQSEPAILQCWHRQRGKPARSFADSLKTSTDDTKTRPSTLRVRFHTIPRSKLSIWDIGVGSRIRWIICQFVVKDGEWRCKTERKDTKGQAFRRGWKVQDFFGIWDTKSSKKSLSEKMETINRGLLSELVAFLSPMKMLRLEMCSDDKLYFNIVAVVYDKLICASERKLKDNELIRLLKTNLSQYLKEKFGVTSYHIIATFMTPLFRKFVCESSKTSDFGFRICNLNLPESEVWIWVSGRIYRNRSEC